MQGCYGGERLPSLNRWRHPLRIIRITLLDHVSYHTSRLADTSTDRTFKIFSTVVSTIVRLRTTQIPNPDAERWPLAVKVLVFAGFEVFFTLLTTI